MQSLSKSSYETYSAWQKRVFCENASRLGTGISVSPQCYDGKQEYECTVIYNTVEKDTVKLCHKCRDNLKRDAMKHKYRFSSRKIP